MRLSFGEERTFLNCCPTGSIPTKEMNDSVPESPGEIIREGLDLAGLGAAILHIHARDSEGKPTWKKEVYRRIIEGIREKNRDIIICTTTSGRFWSDFEKRTEVLDLEGDLKPDMASLTLGSINFMNSASVTSPGMLEDILRKMNDRDIKPEIEVFDIGMLNTLSILFKKGLLKPPHLINVIFGNIHSMQLDLAIVAYLLANCPKDSLIAFGGIGSYHVPATNLALTLGLGARVGLEDTLYLDQERKERATNAGLVARLRTVAAALGRETMGPSDVRKRLFQAS